MFNRLRTGKLSWGLHSCVFFHKLVGGKRRLVQAPGLQDLQTLL